MSRFKVQRPWVCSYVAKHAEGWLCLVALFLVVPMATAVTEYGENFQDVDVSVELSSENIDEIDLPDVDDFFNGLDYVTGNRVGKIFDYSFDKTGTKAGKKHFDDDTSRHFRIPEQVDASNWGSKCSSTSHLNVKKIKSFTSFLEYKSKSWSVDYEQTTDISVTVPLKGAEIGLNTQVQNSLGYGRSSSSQMYRSSFKEGMSACFVQHARNTRWSVQWSDYSIAHLKKQLSQGFINAVADLKATCDSSSNDLTFDERFDPQATHKPTLSKCEEKAKDFVFRYGTHYNKAARFGGVFEQEYTYNEESMTTEEQSIVSTFSRMNAGFLFFKGGKQESTTTANYERISKMNLAITQRDLWYGGSSTKKTVGEWCQSVSRSPVIIENTKIGAMTELLDDKTSKAAVAFAILDKWACNGGHYYRLTKGAPTKPGTCWCPEDDDYELDNRCMPLKKKCKGEPLCNVPKILIGYTNHYLRLDGYGMMGRTANLHDVRFYKPIPKAGYENCGTVACQWKSPAPNKNVVTIHKDTSQEVAQYVEGPQRLSYPRAQMYQPYGCHRADYKKSGNCHHHIDHLYPWRPVCPAGFSQISDFEIDSHSSTWMQSKAFHGENVRGCISNKCLRKCYGKWIWDAGNQKLSMMIVRIAGGRASFGSDLHSRSEICGFFTTTQNKYTLAKQDNLLCLDPACTREVLFD